MVATSGSTVNRHQSYTLLFETATQIVRELSFKFKESFERLKAHQDGHSFRREVEAVVERLLFAAMDEAPYNEMTIEGVTDVRAAMLLEFFVGLGVDEGTAKRYTDSLMESRAQFDDAGQRLPFDPAWRNMTHWRYHLNRWNPVIFASARSTYGRIQTIYRDASETYQGRLGAPDRGIDQIVDLLRRFPEIVPRVYDVVGYNNIEGFPPTRDGVRSTVFGISNESQFEQDVYEHLDAEWWTGIFATAGLVVVGVAVTVLSAGTLGPAAAAVIGAGIGTAQGGMLVLRKSSAVAEGRVAVEMGLMNEAQLDRLEGELDGAWAGLLIDAATGGILGRFGGTSILQATLRGSAINATGGGLAAAADPNVWESEDRVALIMLGVVIGGVAGAAGSAAGSGASELLQRSLKVQLLVGREGGPIRPGRVVRLSVGRRSEPVDATVLSINSYARTVRVNVRGRDYDVRVERTVDIRNHGRRPPRDSDPNMWGRNFEITPIRPNRAPRAPTSALTPSARAALERPNELLMRAYSGVAGGPTTNLAGRSWWARVPIDEARAMITGFETGTVGRGVEHSLQRYGFRPAADPNNAEIWMTDLHSLVSRNPGANFEIDKLGDTVVSTRAPQTLLNSVRRYRFSRRTPVESYWDLVRN